MEQIIQIQNFSKKDLESLIKEQIEDFYNLITKPEPEPELKYVSTKDLANIFGVNPATIWRWRNRGLIEAHGIGNKVLFRLDEVEKAIKPIRNNNK